MHGGHDFVLFQLLLLLLSLSCGILGQQTPGLASSCSINVSCSASEIDEYTPQAVFLQKKIDVIARQTANESDMLKRGSSTDANDLLFIHIPKAAGTSVEDAGLNSGYNWGQNFETSQLGDGDGCEFDGARNLRCEVEGHRNQTCVWRHVPPQYLKGFHNPYYNKDSFCIVRNPFDRFVSEYIYLVSGEYADFQSDEILTEFPACSAEGLNYFAKMALRNLSDFSFDCHLVPQTDYVWGKDGHQWCQNVLRFERMPEAFDSFMDTKSVPVTLPWSNQADGCLGLSIMNLTSVSRAIISRAYHADFVNFNYSFNS